MSNELGSVTYQFRDMYAIQDSCPEFGPHLVSESFVNQTHFPGNCKAARSEIFIQFQKDLLISYDESKKKFNSTTD